MIGILALILQCVVGVAFLFGLAAMAFLPIMLALAGEERKWPWNFLWAWAPDDWWRYLWPRVVGTFGGYVAWTFWLLIPKPERQPRPKKYPRGTPPYV